MARFAVLLTSFVLTLFLTCPVLGSSFQRVETKRPGEKVGAKKTRTLDVKCPGSRPNLVGAECRSGNPVCKLIDVRDDGRKLTCKWKNDKLGKRTCTLIARATCSTNVAPLRDHNQRKRGKVGAGRTRTLSLSCRSGEAVTAVECSSSNRACKRQSLSRMLNEDIKEIVENGQPSSKRFHIRTKAACKFKNTRGSRRTCTLTIRAKCAKLPPHREFKCEDEVLEFKNLKYDFEGARSLADASQQNAITVRLFGKNNANNVQPIPQQRQSFATKTTTQFSFTDTRRRSVTAKVSAKLPFGTGEGGFETTAERTFADGEAQTTERTLTTQFQTPNSRVPPFSSLVVFFTAQMQVATIPFTATAVVKNTCQNNARNGGQVKGSVRISGLANFGSGFVKVITSPAIPVECKDPQSEGVPKDIDAFSRFEWCAPIERTCVSNPKCKRLGLFTGNCCPNDNGEYVGCCADSRANAQCDAFFPENKLVCPSLNGNFAQCCNPLRLIADTTAANTTSSS